MVGLRNVALASAALFSAASAHLTFPSLFGGKGPKIVDNVGGNTFSGATRIAGAHGAEYWAPQGDLVQGYRLELGEAVWAKNSEYAPPKPDHETLHHLPEAAAQDMLDDEEGEEAKENILYGAEGVQAGGHHPEFFALRDKVPLKKHLYKTNIGIYVEIMRHTVRLRKQPTWDRFRKILEDAMHRYEHTFEGDGRGFPVALSIDAYEGALKDIAFKIWIRNPQWERTVFEWNQAPSTDIGKMLAATIESWEPKKDPTEKTPWFASWRKPVKNNGDPV